jgi:hypothetical protein
MGIFRRRFMIASPLPVEKAWKQLEGDISPQAFSISPLFWNRNPCLPVIRGRLVERFQQQMI